MTSAAPDVERCAEPLRGLAPDAPAARYAADWRLLLFAPAALLLQVAHPVIGSGVAQHSIYRADPVRRFDRSYWATLALAFYGDETAEYGRDIRALHKPIGGTDHAGRRYHAWDPEAYFWVLATGYWASTLIADRIEDGLSRAERAELYAGWRQMSLLAGLRERDAPADLDAFEAFFDRVLAQRLERHPSVQDVYEVMRRPPAPARVPNLVWKPVMWGVVGPFAAWVNTGVLPPEIRDLFGRTWTHRDERLLRVFFRTVRVVDRVLPAPIRGITRTVAVRRQHGIKSTVRAAADAA
ncbi:oxygenase MpaB family protein [Nocardia wallacei]|uniref:oxygenase MpaB family protein n=1 Tax=Nocardia wallacei TaxID=480035 RepID=UPI0024557B28|nr:oxygenase MpaB family protein [Nocardia wallacei]